MRTGRARDDLYGPARLTVTVRWILLVTATCGTRGPGQRGAMVLAPGGNDSLDGPGRTPDAVSLADGSPVGQPSASAPPRRYIAATGHERAPGPPMTGAVPCLGAWLERAVARGGGVDPSRRTLGKIWTATVSAGALVSLRSSSPQDVLLIRHIRGCVQAARAFGDQVILDMSVNVVVRPIPSCPPDMERR